MHKCKENMNAMLVLKISKHKNVFFKKFLIFLIFQKFENLGCYILPPLKGISSPRFEEARRMGLKTLGFENWVGYHP